MHSKASPGPCEGCWFLFVVVHQVRNSHEVATYPDPAWWLAHSWATKTRHPRDGVREGWMICRTPFTASDVRAGPYAVPVVSYCALLLRTAKGGRKGGREGGREARTCLGRLSTGPFLHNATRVALQGLVNTSYPLESTEQRRLSRNSRPRTARK